MSDNNQIAATLAAAIIQVGGTELLEGANLSASDTAARIYFNCVESLEAEGQRRSQTTVAVLDI